MSRTKAKHGTGPKGRRAPARPPAVQTREDSYQQHKARVAARMRALSEAGREIGPLPRVADAARKRRCARSLALYCQTYLPGKFYLPFSAAHRRVIKKIEQTVFEGGQSAIAMPRGDGKTSLCEAAILWAISYGYRKFGMIIGAELNKAVESLEAIKMALETNDRLAADFPEICFPIRALGRVHQRAPGQLFKGAPTFIDWTQTQIVLPSIPRSKAAGAIIRVVSITGAIRGAKFARPDGAEVRPDLVLVDDPQTRESAKSPTQCDDREAVLKADIGRLGAPGVRIGILAAVTVILPDDLSSRLLDPEKNPAWHGERTRMMLSLPADSTRWEEYARLRKVDQQANDRGYARSNAYYRKHRAAMDAGAEAAWPERYDEGEASAIQHAMNIKIDFGDASFFAECQNEPRTAELAGSPKVGANLIVRKLHGLERGVPPAWAQWITAHIDVGHHVLWYLVAGWGEDFSGAVIDYGTWPGQPARQIDKSKLGATLDRA